jgi:hypothetical protein
MQKVFSFVGGRKMSVVYLVILLLVLNKVLDLGLDRDTVFAITGVGIGGAGAVALEDGLKGKKGGGK